MYYHNVVSRNDIVSIVDEQLLPVCISVAAFKQTYSKTQRKFRAVARFDMSTGNWPKQQGQWADYFIKEKNHQLILYDVVSGWLSQHVTIGEKNIPKYVCYKYVVKKGDYERYYFIITHNPKTKEMEILANHLTDTNIVGQRLDRITEEVESIRRKLMGTMSA